MVVEDGAREFLGPIMSLARVEAVVVLGASRVWMRDDGDYASGLVSEVVVRLDGQRGEQLT